MVYLGRPSRGCQTCKTRRVKCDETKPACKNCIRTNRECPGLPEEVDLIFRAEAPGRKKAKKVGKSDVDVTALKILVDQYEEHQIRAEQKARQPTTAASSRSHSPLQWLKSDGIPIAPRSRSESSIVPQMSLNPAVEKQATVFFFNNFIFNSRNSETTRGFLELAVPMFQASDEGSPLHLATEAVSVSVVANWPERKHLKQRAARLYGLALQATQQALQDPKHACSNETLLTILMFSLYESVTSSDHSVAAWARHIEGAVAIVKARGIKQFDDAQSLLLFRAVRTQMLTNALQQRKEIPEFPGINGWTGDMKGDRTAAATLIESTVKLPSLLARAKPLFLSEKNPETITEATQLLHEAYDIQQALSSWELQIPAEWGYRSVSNCDSKINANQVEEMEVWPGPTMHVYKDVHIACVRNNNRVSHMLCSSVVVDALKWLDPSPEHYMLDQRFTTARTRLQQLADDICCSVPFHLYGSDVVENVRPVRRTQDAPEAIGGYFLIWPLYTASNMPEVPELQRRWMRGRLAAISRYYSIDQSNVMNSPGNGRSGTNLAPPQYPSGHSQDRRHSGPASFPAQPSLGPSAVSPSTPRSPNSSISSTSPRRQPGKGIKEEPKFDPSLEADRIGTMTSAYIPMRRSSLASKAGPKPSSLPPSQTTTAADAASSVQHLAIVG